MSKARVAIVTGVSTGIGAAIAARLGKSGHAVVGAARREANLQKLAAELEPVMDIATLAVDVTTEDAPKRIVDFALERHGRIDVLINNAGSGCWAPVHGTTDEMLDEVLFTSLRAPFRLSRETLPHLTAGSSIVFISSTFGLLGGLDGGAYCAVKAGLIGLSQTMAAQYGRKGIRTNVVAPGVIPTPMTNAHWNLPGFQRVNQEMTPIGRDGTTEDVANAVNFLCSEEASYINGQVLTVDGGWSTTKFLSYEAITAERIAKPAAE